MKSRGLNGVGDVRPPATGGIGGGNGNKIGGPLGPEVFALGAFNPCGGVLADVGLWAVVVLGAVLVGADVAGAAGLAAGGPGAGVGC